MKQNDRQQQISSEPVCFAGKQNNSKQINTKQPKSEDKKFYLRLGFWLVDRFGGFNSNRQYWLGDD